MLIISLRSFSPNLTAEDQTKVTAGIAARFLFVHSDFQLNYHDLVVLKSELSAHRWSHLPHQTSYKNYRETPPQRPTAESVLDVCMPYALTMNPTTKPDRREGISTTPTTSSSWIQSPDSFGTSTPTMKQLASLLKIAPALLGGH